MPSDIVEATVNERWKILLPRFRADRPEWNWWEKERLASMYETTTPGDVVYYVGAESGDMAGLLAMWGAELVLFEPNQKAWPQIRAVWEANDLKMPLKCWYGFASDKTDLKAQGSSTDGWPEVSKGELVPNHGFKELKDPGEIREITIDDICKQNPVPDMISIDVEGAEGRVLRGAQQTLLKYHPRIYLSLHHEFLHQGYGEMWFELCNWIKSLGYSETIIGNQPHEGHILYERA